MAAPRDQVGLMITAPSGDTFTLSVPATLPVWRVESAARSLAGVHNRFQVYPMGQEQPLADPERPFGDETPIGDRLEAGQLHMVDVAEGAPETIRGQAA